MSADTSGGGKKDQQQAVEHITEATKILRALRHDLDQHPEIEEAIQKLELALAILAVKTGGLL